MPDHDHQTPYSHKDGDAEPTPGAAGHPEPGSGHDDSKLETVEDGPPTRRVDGIPGAHGEGRTVGGAIDQATAEGAASEHGGL
jgi:hypothetical protein